MVEQSPRGYLRKFSPGRVERGGQISARFLSVNVGEGAEKFAGIQIHAASKFTPRAGTDFFGQQNFAQRADRKRRLRPQATIVVASDSVRFFCWRQTKRSAGRERKNYFAITDFNLRKRLVEQVKLQKAKVGEKVFA